MPEEAKTTPAMVRKGLCPLENMPHHIPLRAVEFEATAAAGKLVRSSATVDALEREFEVIRQYLEAYAPTRKEAA